MTDVLASEYDVDTDTFVRPEALANLVDVLTVVEDQGTRTLTLHVYYDPSSAKFSWGQKSSHGAWLEEAHLLTGPREELRAGIDTITFETPDRAKIDAALRTLDSFDHEGAVIGRYTNLRSYNHELETIGSRLSNLGEHILAGGVWAASAKVMTRRQELHPDFIAAKNSKGHDWVANPDDTLADAQLNEDVTARAAAAEVAAIDWAAVIIEETAKHDLHTIFGADGRDNAFFTCSCGHRQSIPAMTTYQNGWHTEYDEVLFRAPFYKHQTEATAAAVAALIKESHA